MDWNVRLALRVVAEQDVEAGRKIHVQPRVIAEVTESEMGQMHAGKINGNERAASFFGEEGADTDLGIETAT